MNNGEYSLARDHFDNAVQLTPSSAPARYNLAIVLTSQLEQHAKALKHCALAMKYDPSHYKAVHLMGNIMQSLGKEEDAQK